MLDRSKKSKPIVIVKSFTITLFFLFSCSAINIPSYYITPFVYAYESIIDKPDTQFSKNLIDSIPYASMKVKIGKGNSGLVILEKIDKDETSWVSADEVNFLIKNGKIIRTSGLTNNLSGYQGFTPKFSELLKREIKLQPLEFTSYYSFSQPDLLDLKVSIILKYEGEREIEILGNKKKVLLVEEIIRGKKIGWKARNRYWVDPNDGFIWKSTQSVSPKIPEIRYEVTKKPAI
jgi:hypothetical protein